MHCSKWLKHAALLESSALRDLLAEMGPLFFLPASGIVLEDSWRTSQDDFLARYDSYIESLLVTKAFPSAETRRFFSLMLSPSLDDFYAIKTGEGRFALKACKPVIQVQLYHAFISSFDHQIHSMALSPGSFAFGLQISYPQIYEDPKTHQFSKVLTSEEFASSLPFKKMVQWFRKNTKPAVLFIDQQRVCAPFRVGKEGRDFVGLHVELQKVLGGLCQKKN